MPSSSGLSTAAPPGSFAYADGADMAIRFDIRTISDLVSDDEQRLSRSEALSTAILETALATASGRFEAALQSGGRYSLEDLANVIAINSNCAEYVKQIVCELTMVLLLQRRPGAYAELLERVSASVEASLKLLQDGRDVFNLDRQLSAGLIMDGGSTNKEPPHLLKTRSLISDNTISQLFPRRETAQQRYRQ